uniref:Endoplasmin (inferred by orthology to a human protein) n=1 Tax=Strongyloides venezuelensis TaxID=75913 RepID=A0A0K0FLR4_STRVS
MLKKKNLIFILLLQAFVAELYCNNNNGSTIDAADKVDIEPKNVLSEEPPKAFLTKEEVEKMSGLSEKFQFQAEISRMMKLIINSLYKNKEIFMRELISNAADALDKIRFLSYHQKDALSTTEDLLIRIQSDPVAQTITLTDTGIGMTKEELITHLGTIAKSGTANFIERIMNASNLEEQRNLIGQFGVGFYSVFLVAEKVVVRSKHNNDTQHIWISDASSYTIMEDPEGDTLKRGTEITLYLKDDAKQFSELNKLRHLIHTYSQFVTFDIYAYEKQEPSKDDAKKNDGNDDTEKSKVVKYAWEKINGFKPLWVRQPKNVTEEEYEFFYNGLILNPFDRKPSLGRIHFHTEGDVIFKGIFYIPGKLNEKMEDNVLTITKLIKLYVRRIYITDEISEILPRYLSWVAGVIDSDDLPLNVSREVLQTSKLLRLIKKKVVRKILEMIGKLKAEAFCKFYAIYSRKLKHGILEDHENANKIAKLLRFNSSYNGNETTLDEYISRMKDDQKEIFYLGGESIHEIKTSPLVEKYINEHTEVLYCFDPLDENIFDQLRMYKNKKFRNLAINNEEDNKTSKEDDNKEDYAKLIQWFKKNIIDSKVEKVVISKRLSSSPAAYVATENGISGYRAKLIRATQILSKTSAQSILDKLRYNFEINPNNGIIKILNKMVENDENNELVFNIGHLVSETAMLRSGFTIEKPDAFAHRIEKLIRKNVQPLEQSPKIVENKEKKCGEEMCTSGFLHSEL